jgi:predicted transcriptional regulator
VELHKIKEILNASVLCGEDQMHQEVTSAFSCDLMSDVLSYVESEAMLLTGLVNPQTVRTADMLDMKCIIFVRGKIPDSVIIKMAKDRGITIMCCEYTMYVASGRLYAAGLGDS